jgi:tRNA threonylcarbamoyladenosine modification (KEOPS) complex  Pcc1 subunit
MKAQLSLEKELRTHGLQAMATDVATLRNEVRTYLDLLRTDLKEDIREVKQAVMANATPIKK